MTLHFRHSIYQLNWASHWVTDCKYYERSLLSSSSCLSLMRHHQKIPGFILPNSMHDCLRTMHVTLFHLSEFEQSFYQKLSGEFFKCLQQYFYSSWFLPGSHASLPHMLAPTWEDLTAPWSFQPGYFHANHGSSSLVRSITGQFWLFWQVVIHFQGAMRSGSFTLTFGQSVFPLMSLPASWTFPPGPFDVHYFVCCAYRTTLRRPSPLNLFAVELFLDTEWNWE